MGGVVAGAVSGIMAGGCDGLPCVGLRWSGYPRGRGLPSGLWRARDEFRVSKGAGVSQTVRAGKQKVGSGMISLITRAGAAGAGAKASGSA